MQRNLWARKSDLAPPSAAKSGLAALWVKLWVEQLEPWLVTCLKCWMVTCLEHWLVICLEVWLVMLFCPARPVAVPRPGGRCVVRPFGKFFSATISRYLISSNPPSPDSNVSRAALILVLHGFENAKHRKQ